MTTAETTRDAVFARMLSLVRGLVHGKLDNGNAGADTDERILDLNLVDDLGLDSVQILDLLMTVEQEFRVQLDSEEADLDKLMRVSALVDFVCRGSSAVL